MVTKSRVKSFFANKRNQKYILLYFLLLSVIMFWPLHHMTYLYRGQDLKFHISRIEELYHCLRDGGFFVYLSTYTGNKIGIATNVFYPNLFIYLYAGLRFIIRNPIKAVYIGTWLVNLLSLLSSYFSYKIFSKSNLKAFLFANIFGLSTYRYTDILWRFDLGEFIALIFVPLTLVAFYEMLYERKEQYWPLLAIGMAGLLYSHMMTVMIMTAFLLLVYLCSLPKLKERKTVFLHLAYAALSFIVLGLGFLVSFFKFYTSGSIRHPKLPFTFLNSAYVPSQLFNATINNQLVRPFNLGLISLFIIGLVIFNYKKIDRFYRYLFWLAMIFLWMATRLFPWSVVPDTITTMLQFPYRFLMLAAIFMAAVGAEVIANFTGGKVIAALLPFMLLISVASVYHFVDYGNRKVDIVYEQMDPYVHPRLMTKEQQHIHPSRFDLHQYYANLLGTKTHYGYNDYAPWQMKVDEQDDLNNFKQIIKHRYQINGHGYPLEKLASIPNGLVMKLKLEKGAPKVSLPFYIYQHNDYQLVVNGQSKKVKSDQFYNLQTDLKKGQNTIRVQYIPATSQIVAVVISWLGFVILLLYALWQKRQQQKKTA